MPHVDEKFKDFAKLNLAMDNKAFVRQRTRIVKAFKFITLRVCLSLYLISGNILCD